MKIPDIRKVKPGKLSNPIPEAERIFKCVGPCGKHKYWPEKTVAGNLCKECYEQQVVKANRSTQINNVARIRHPSPDSPDVPTSTGENQGPPSAPSDGDQGSSDQSTDGDRGEVGG